MHLLDECISCLEACTTPTVAHLSSAHNLGMNLGARAKEHTTRHWGARTKKYASPRRAHLMSRSACAKHSTPMTERAHVRMDAKGSTPMCMCPQSCVRPRVHAHTSVPMLVACALCTSCSLKFRFAYRVYCNNFGESVTTFHVQSSDYRGFEGTITFLKAIRNYLC